jgi:hypothetical protein
MNMEEFNLEKTRHEISLEKLSKDTMELNESERNASLANIEKGDKLDDKTLPDEMVVNAVRRACKFFGIPEVPIVNAHGACVWPNDTRTYNDDVFGFNREQLMSLGISGEDSLTLIYTHECAHRTLQGAYNDAWEEELACDFFAGVHPVWKVWILITLRHRLVLPLAETHILSEHFAPTSLNMVNR